MASREVAHRPDRRRGMLFLCGGRPLALCSETWLRGCCCIIHFCEARSIHISQQMAQIDGFGLSNVKISNR